MHRRTEWRGREGTSTPLSLRLTRQHGAEDEPHREHRRGALLLRRGLELRLRGVHGPGPGRLASLPGLHGVFHRWGQARGKPGVVQNSERPHQETHERVHGVVAD